MCVIGALVGCYLHVTADYIFWSRGRTKKSAHARYAGGSVLKRGVLLCTPKGHRGQDDLLPGCKRYNLLSSALFAHQLGCPRSHLIRVGLGLLPRLPRRSSACSICGIWSGFLCAYNERKPYTCVCFTKLHSNIGKVFFQ